MAENTNVTEKVKEGVLPSAERAGTYVAAGVSVFSGFALAGFVSSKTAPVIAQHLPDGKIAGLVSAGTVSSAATAVVASVVHTLVKDTKAGKFEFAGVRGRDITFYATAGAFANVLGHILLDLFDTLGGEGETMMQTKEFLGTVTGVGSPVAAEA